MYPVTKVSTEEVLKKMKKYKDLVGPIENVITDNATCFISKQYYEGMDNMKINACHISVHNPASNMAERVMSQIGNGLRILLRRPKHNYWVRHIKEIEYSINNSEHGVTLITPNELHFRTLMKDQLAVILDLPEKEIDVEKNNELALERTKKAQEFRDKRARQNPGLKLGDKVKIKSFNLSNKKEKISAKLLECWKGPYRVVEQIRENRYRLQHEEFPDVIKHQSIRNIISKLSDILQDNPKNPKINKWKRLQIEKGKLYKEDTKPNMKKISKKNLL